MKKKRKQAAALSYQDKSKLAPIVSAKGEGLVAENIIKEAKNHEIPILEDPSLVEILGEIEINRAIPNELYRAVAEVFAYIYHVDKQTSDDK